MTRKLAVALLFVCLHGASSAAAQTPARAFELALSRSFGASSAAHPPPCGSPCNFRDVLAPISFVLLEIEFAVPLTAAERSGLEWFGRLVPFALVRENPTEPAVRSRNGWGLPTNSPRSSTVGVGVKPVGLRGWVGGTVRMEADFSVGVVRFGTPLLASNATRLNFTYEFGIGLRASGASRRGVVLGYRRHHVSNAGLGEVNPGLNSHLMFLGLPLG